MPPPSIHPPPGAVPVASIETDAGAPPPIAGESSTGFQIPPVVEARTPPTEPAGVTVPPRENGARRGAAPPPPSARDRRAARTVPHAIESLLPAADMRVAASAPHPDVVAPWRPPEGVSAPAASVDERLDVVGRRGPRRRRSAALLPPVPQPRGLSEDADGRIRVFGNTVPTVEELREIMAASGGRVPAAEAAPRPGPLDAATGWAAVGALGAVLLAVFLVGLLLTR